jgi:phosphoglycerate kinase
MIINLEELELGGKKVLIRQDLNVPIKAGVVTSDKRIKASLPTIEIAMKQGAKVMLMSHRGRPIEGEVSDEFTLQPVADRLSELLGVTVRLEKNWLDGVEMSDGEVVLCENVRFNKGEMSNDDALSKRMAAMCDIFAMDAFGTAHRAQASTHGVAKYAPIACSGPLLSGELEALGKALDNPKSSSHSDLPTL